MKVLTISLLFLASQIFSFTPGKWSHKDIYLLSKNKVGPSKEIVKGADGTTIYTAEYLYDSDGHLIQESYFDKDGNPDGQTLFKYREGLILTEEIFNSSNSLIEKKDFIYANKTLTKLLTKNPSGRIQIQYNLQTDKEGFINSGEGKNTESNDIESFKYFKDSKRPNIQIQKLLDENKRTLGEIIFKFDSQSKLSEREFNQGEIQRFQKFKYNDDGILESYSFHVKQTDSLVLEKTHLLIYNKLPKK